MSQAEIWGATRTRLELTERGIGMKLGAGKAGRGRAVAGGLQKEADTEDFLNWRPSLAGIEV